MPPERPWIDSCTAASCRPQLVGNSRPLCDPNNIETRASIPCQQNGHIRCRSSCLICTLPTADDKVGGHSGKTGRRLMLIRWCACWPPTDNVAWLPPPGNLGSGWSGHASVDMHLDSPHAVASLVYSPPPHSTDVQGLQKFSKMQLHRAATRAFGYTVHDGSLHADRHRRSDYVTAFHLAGCLPFQDSRPFYTWHHESRLPVNDRFPQNDYRFCYYRTKQWIQLKMPCGQPICRS